MSELKFDPLLEYAKFVLNGPIFRLRPPKNAIHENTQGISNNKVTSIILDRQGRFQTEMFVFSKDIRSVEGHTHPGVDSIELAVAGDFVFMTDTGSIKQETKGLSIAHNGMANIPEDVPHGADLTDGACFFSFQHWKNEEPTSIGNSFLITGGDLYGSTNSNGTGHTASANGTTIIPPGGLFSAE